MTFVTGLIFRSPTLWPPISRQPKRFPLTRQIDQAHGDLYAIADDLAFLKVQLARLPTRTELTRAALGVTNIITTLAQLHRKMGSHTSMLFNAAMLNYGEEWNA
jgi:hypothetical protein